MNLIFDRSIFFRILIVVILCCTALGLYLINRSTLPKPPEQLQQNIAAAAIQIDREIDSVLAQYLIEKSWSRKRQVAIPGTTLYRIERKVMIPTDIIPVQMNRTLNIMAKRYEGRAIGSENLKENTTTIHIKLENYIIETIVLKLTKDLVRGIIRLDRKKV